MAATAWPASWTRTISGKKTTSSHGSNDRDGWRWNLAAIATNATATARSIQPNGALWSGGWHGGGFTEGTSVAAASRLRCAPCRGERGPLRPELLDERRRVGGLLEQSVDVLPRASERLAHRHALQGLDPGVEDDRVPRGRGDRVWVARDAASPEVGPRVLWWLHDRPLDVLVGDESLDLTRGDQSVVQPLVAAHVVVLQVDQPQLGVRPLEAVPLAVAVE